MRHIVPIVLMLTAAAPAAQTPQAPPAKIAAPSDVATPPADAVKTASGLATKVIAKGTANFHPTKDDVVVIHYTGWKSDGSMFDSSVPKGKPSIFGVGRVIAGFSEGLQLMVPGEKRRLWIPESLAYKGQREPKGMLCFDVELIDVPSHPPPDVKAPPPEAKKTASGLSYRVLKDGIGGRHPRATGAVTVNYTGWTTDGKMFDSSVVRGEPANFQVDQVIPGWTEGLQLMYEGEKTRFWIPEALAYKGKSAPYGMLVFDVELVKIQ